MSQYPALCTVSYDGELPSPRRSPRLLKRVGSAGPVSRHERSKSYPGPVNFDYLSVRKGVKAEEYTTPHRLSLKPEPPKERHTSQLTQSLTSPRYDDNLLRDNNNRLRELRDDFKLPVLRCGGAGETSLTVNAELLQDPKWNDYITAWVSGRQDGYRAYLRIARAMSLIDRGIIHYLPEFENLPPIPCPRFWHHMHGEKLPAPPAEKPKKKVIKKPEFWSWKNRTEPEIPSLNPPVTKQVKWEEPAEEKAVTEVDEEPSDYGSLQSELDPDRSFISATSSGGQTPNCVWNEPIPKTPPILMQLTTPPKTATTMQWEEHSNLSDSAIDSWDPMSPLEPLDFDLDTFFTNEYIEVLEPVEWGWVEPTDEYDLSKLTEGIKNPGLEITMVPPVEEESLKPDKIEDTDRVEVLLAPVEVEPTPEPPPKPPTPSPTPPPPKEPTPPPPKEPTPPPTPKQKRKPVVKKQRKAPPPKFKVMTPVEEPISEPITDPTPPPKVQTPVKPVTPVVAESPVKPPPSVPLPTVKQNSPSPSTPAREPTPQTPVAVPELPVVPPKSPSPEPPQPSPEPAETPPTPPPEKPGLPPPRKDLEFLAEMERERLAEERRLKSFRLFEKMKKRVSFPKGKMDEIVCVEEYGWLPKFCIIKEEYKRMYKMAFETIDENGDGYLNCFETMLALKGVTNINNMTEKEEEYVYRVLEIADYNIAFGTDFRLFAVIAALAQKIVSIDHWVKNLIKKMDLETLDWKMYRAKELFKWCLDEDSNQLSVKKLMIELKAGGVSEEHQEEARQKFGNKGVLDLLDFLSYLPLFIMTHESVVDNPLDDTRDR